MKTPLPSAKVFRQWQERIVRKLARDSIVRRLLTVTTVIGLTILLAPLGFAASNGLMASHDDADRSMQAYRLLQAFREHHPDAPPHITQFDGDIEDCGYRREQLFAPGDRLPRDGGDERWTPYLGYWDLFIWRGRQWDREVEGRLLHILRERTGAFSSEFLQTCMRHSLFASLCARRVGAILAAGGWRGGGAAPDGQRLDQSVQNRTICTYLDGLAARRGHSVANRVERRHDEAE